MQYQIVSNEFISMEGNREFRALVDVDGTNDFADYEKSDTHEGSQMPVPGGKQIGLVIGALQREGKRLGIYDLQIGIRDTHKLSMFNFAHNCPGKRAFVDKIPDRDGVLTTIYPAHQIAGTWGWQWIDGTVEEDFDTTFEKGVDQDKDEFSGALPQVIAYLRRHKIVHIDLVGLVLRICVGLTAIDFVKAGFKVRIISDATRDLEIQDMAYVLDDLKELGVKFVTSKQVLGEFIVPKINI